MITPPLKWFGGKHYLAGRIVALMPGHAHYVEPFAGGLAVLLAKDPDGVSEVVNDLHGHLMNFWRVLQGDDFPRFHRFLEAQPFAEASWQEASSWWKIVRKEPARFESPNIEAACAFFILARQSLSGRMKAFAPLSRNRVRRGMNEQASAWLTCIDGLPEVHARMRRVVLLCRDALAVIKQQDGPGTLFYCDPPYLHETRAAKDVYHHEMSHAGHAGLLDALLACKGRVMLSGYRSDLYDQRLAGWNRHDFDLPNNAAGGDEKRRMTECLWCNF